MTMIPRKIRGLPNLRKSPQGIQQKPQMPPSISGNTLGVGNQKMLR